MYPLSEKTMDLSRRAFLASTLKAAGAAALLTIPGISAAASLNTGTYTVQQVIDLILKNIPGAPFPQTVDTLKSGDPQQTVTGIVTTMFPTVEVIRAAIARKANFIIAHEPAFYNHADDTAWVKPNRVLDEKQALLQQHGIAVWRFHDYWHSHRPDGIGYGVLQKTGWMSYYQGGAPVLQLPPATLRQLVSHLKKSLGIPHLRVIGDLSQSCARVAFLPGSAGGKMQVGIVETEKPDVLIVGELQEWETAEYIRDAQLLGHKTALIVLGHVASEEPGMEWLVQWLQPKVPGLPVTHIPSGSPFTWV